AYGPEPLADGTLIVVKLVDRGDHQLFHFKPDSGKLEPLPAFLQARDISPLLRAFPDGKEIVYFGTHGQNGRSESPKMWVLDLATQRARELAPGINLDPLGAWGPLAVTPDGE